MGEIINKADRFNKDRFNETVEIASKKNTKPSLKTNDLKSLCTLVAPNCNKRFKISKNQRTFQKNARITLGVLIATLGISAGVAAYSNINQPSVSKTGIESENSNINLNKEDILEDAEDIIKEKMSEYYKTSSEKIDISYNSIFDDGDGTFSNQAVISCDDKQVTFYDDFLTNNIIEDKNLSSVIKTAIQLNLEESPTQSSLENIKKNLETQNKKLEDIRLEKNSKDKIIGVNQKDIDNEI